MNLNFDDTKINKKSAIVKQCFKFKKENNNIILNIISDKVGSYFFDNICLAYMLACVQNLWYDHVEQIINTNLTEQMFNEIANWIDESLASYYLWYTLWIQKNKSNHFDCVLLKYHNVLKNVSTDKIDSFIENMHIKNHIHFETAEIYEIKNVSNYYELLQFINMNDFDSYVMTLKLQLILYNLLFNEEEVQNQLDDKIVKECKELYQYFWILNKEIFLMYLAKLICSHKEILKLVKKNNNIIQQIKQFIIKDLNYLFFDEYYEQYIFLKYIIFMDIDKWFVIKDAYYKWESGENVEIKQDNSAEYKYISNIFLLYIMCGNSAKHKNTLLLFYPFYNREGKKNIIDDNDHDYHMFYIIYKHYLSVKSIIKSFKYIMKNEIDIETYKIDKRNK